MSNVAFNRSAMGMKPRGLFKLVVLSMITLVATAASAGDKRFPPGADKPGSADDPLLGRYSGSVIMVYDRLSLGEMVLPLSALEPVRPGVENGPLRPRQAKVVEGVRTHFLYHVGKESSPLEVVRSYQEEIRSQGGRVAFECKDEACGGAAGNVFAGPPGMLNFLYPRERGRKMAETLDPAGCAMGGRPEQLFYSTVDLGGGRGFAAIAAYRGKVGGICDYTNGETFVSVDLLDTTPRKSRITTVNSAEIARALQGSGKIALYGIYFDVDKADVKPESDETLEQIAKLMKERPGLKLMVVGHTDNTGNFDANMDLSQRRAASVVEELRERYGVRQDRLRPIGVSYAAPVAPNKTEEGRAKNRRVELVEQ